MRSAVRLGTILAAMVFILTIADAKLGVTAQTVTPTEESQTEEVDPEVIALRAQLEQMQRTDDQFLQTIYWSLGTILAVSIILVTYGWFSSTRSYDRDRDAMRQELHATLREDVMVFQDSVRADVASQLAGIKTDIVATTSNALDANKWTIRDLERSIEYLRYDVLKIQEAHWDSTGVLENVLLMNLEKYSVGKKLSADRIIAEAIGAISRSLAEGARPDAETASEITSVLDDAPPQHGADVEAARKLLLEARGPDRPASS